MTIAKRHLPAFIRAQARVAESLKPYLGRCLEQYYSANGQSAVETFLVCSKEADAGEGRHTWRGVVTVYYGFGTAREDANVTFSFAEDMLHASLGVSNTGTWTDTNKVLEILLPPLPIEGATVAPVGEEAAFEAFWENLPAHIPTDPKAVARLAWCGRAKQAGA